jgi:hypothetical protein
MLFSKICLNLTIAGLLGVCTSKYSLAQREAKSAIERMSAGEQWL